MKKNKIYICKGLPASGKTTWSLEMLRKNPNKIKRVSKDSLREMLDNNGYYKNSEDLILAVRNSIIGDCLAHGCDVIVDDTNLNPIHERILRKEFSKYAEIIIQDFTDVDYNECIERDSKREKPVGVEVIMGMYTSYIMKKYKIVKDNSNLKSCVLCDLDGTIALLNGRSPYDEKLCENDIVNEPIKKILSNFENVIFLSGRKDYAREHTIRWLNKNEISFTELHMRKSNDSRKDKIIKEEMFNEFIKDKWDVEFVLDDRNQCVDLWRELGLTCLQVNYGDF